MPRVEQRVRIGPGLTLAVERDDGDLYLVVGRFVVETIGGSLVVRYVDRPVNETPILRIPLDA